MSLSFRSITQFPRGTLGAMLTEAYAFDPRCAVDWGKDWRTFDDFFFDNPKIAERYGFVTMLNAEEIGFMSWDPRQLPEYVQIGHNCILPRHRGNGYGTMQLQQAVRQITRECPAKIIVTTSGSFISAQRMYESVGFRCVGRRASAHFSGDLIDYELFPESCLQSGSGGVL